MMSAQKSGDEGVAPFQNCANALMVVLLQTHKEPFTAKMQAILC